MHSPLLLLPAFRLALLAAGLAGTFTIAVAGAEDLPAQGDLLLRLEAVLQDQARQRTAMPPLRPGQGIDTLLDVTAHQAHLVQPLEERRPVLIKDEISAFWRFDGQNDFLFRDHRNQLSAELTLFVLAAPKANPGILPLFLPPARQPATILRMD